MSQSNKVFVGNISHSASEDTLKDLFATVGNVLSVKIVTDNFTGRPRGFGFVEMSSADEADKAISELNNHELEGRNLRVDRAKQRENRPAGGGMGGSGGFRPRSGGSSNGGNRFGR
jgi:RNA recognition motif-containing protein